MILSNLANFLHARARLNFRALYLGDQQTINVLGRLLRIDESAGSVVLGFDYLPDRDAEKLDRFALGQLSEVSSAADA